MKTEITIYTAPINGGPFNCRPAMTHEIPADRIVGCPVFFPWEHRHGADSLYIICNEFGAMGAVWADNEQDALDELIDANLGGGIETEEPTTEDEEQDVSRAGNNGRAVDMTHCSILRAVFEPARDWKLMCAFHEMRGSGQPLENFV